MRGRPRRTVQMCKVCGSPTISKYGICSKTAPCRRAQDRYRRTGRVDAKPTPPKRPCKVCGAPTTSRIGICRRTAQCRNEAMCHRKGYTMRLFCAACGGPMRSHCKWRFCTRNPQCRRLHDMEAYRAEPERMRANRRRSAARHAQEIRDRELVLRRLRGVRPHCRGRNNPQWAGGRVVFCHVCGRCAGWRTPSQIRRRKRFLCKEHGRESWKWNLSNQPQRSVLGVPQAGGDR